MLNSNQTKIKIRLTRWGIVSLALVAAFGAVGIVFASTNGTGNIAKNNCGTTPGLRDCFTWVVSNDDASVQNKSPYGNIDPGDNGKDPDTLQTLGVALPVGVTYPQPGRYTNNVATTTAVLSNFQNGYYYGISVTINNAYPYYYPTIFFGLKNPASVSMKVTGITVDENYTGTNDVTPDLIPDITTVVDGISVGQVIGAGQEVVGRLGINIEQAARQNWTYHIMIRITKVAQQSPEKGGTIGWWKNWRNHYKESQIISWVKAVDSPNTYTPPSGSPPAGGTAGSAWLGPTTTTGLSTMFSNYSNSAKTKFLAQYEATRLNVQANNLNLYNYHDITSISGYSFLGLSNPNSVQLWQIIAAVESQYGQSWTSNANDNKYNIMKDIFDALNQEPPAI